MNIYFVVNHARDWPFEIEGVRVLTAREYLTDPAYAEHQSARIVNLCRTDRYQGRGYYVSLLAEARGHRALPEVKTLGDLHAREIDGADLAVFGVMRGRHYDARRSRYRCARRSMSRR